MYTILHNKLDTYFSNQDTLDQFLDILNFLAFVFSNNHNLQDMNITTSTTITYRIWT